MYMHIFAISFFRSTKIQTVRRNGWCAGAGKQRTSPILHTSTANPQNMAAAVISDPAIKHKNYPNDVPVS